jgi:chromosome partitioning protein
MAETIAFLNMKGGVGKTTLAVNIAFTLAIKQNKKILIIDLDPQYNATQYLIDLKKYPHYVNGESPTVFNIIAPKGLIYNSILTGTKKIEQEKEIELKDVTKTIWKKENARLDLIPGTIHLINLHMADRGAEHRLELFIKKIQKAYDFILVDCPPTFSIFLLAGILACDYYLVPVKPDPLSVLGVPLLERVIEYYKDSFGNVIEPLGIVFTMVRNTKMMDEVMDGVKQTSVGKRYIFNHYLRNSTYYAEATKAHKPLFDIYKAKYYGHSKDVDRVTEEFLSLFR